MFIALIQNRKIKLEKPKEFLHWIEQFEGKLVEIHVKRKTKKRTTGKHDELGNQNGWYWGCILPICAKELGYTNNEMHEIFTNEYAPYRSVKYGNKFIKVSIRTSEMNTVQFAEYCETIRMAMAELGIIIPDPYEAH